MKFFNAVFLLCILHFSTNSFAQNRIIGHVLDFDETPLASVQIRSQADNGLLGISDQAGRYEILYSDISAVLVFDGSLNGYGIIERSVENLLKDPDIQFISQYIQSDYIFNPLTVYSNWTKRKEPFTADNLNNQALNKYNFGNDLPMLLQFETSVVHTSDAGAGVGYTGLRIRGSDQTRINVTINGVPVNDSESQGVFWVNVSDIAASTEQIQIQRGAGPSTNGVGSFGASLNLSTIRNKSTPGVELTQTIGSFNTKRTSIAVNSGGLGSKGQFQFNGRYSRITSDGYIDRATSDLSSYYLEGGYQGSRISSRLIFFGGEQVTYQAWNGLPVQWINGENRTANTAGLRSDGSSHDNQVDNYIQNHIHWVNTAKLSKLLDLNLTAHYTKGQGFYEEFRENDRFVNYGLSNVETVEGTISRGDLVRRRWLDNDFMGIIGNLAYTGGRLTQTLGGGYNYYEGLHFGEVLWSEAGNLPEFGTEYYNNMGKKYDANIFYSANYALTDNLFGYLDLQYRFVNFDFIGINRDLEPLAQNVNLNFFNPKIGLTLIPETGLKYYISAAVANKEPNRRDYVDAPPSDQPLPERLYNVEMGFEKRYSDLLLKANLYGMYYRDQLVLNGEINDVGAYTRVNVDKSYRAGVEVASIWQVINSLSVYGNLTLSDNRILNYENYVDVWDDGSQRREFFERTFIAFSPSIVGALGISLTPANIRGNLPWWVPGSLSLDLKYISRQYLDNTGDVLRSLDPYSFTNLKIEYLFSLGSTRVNIFGSVNNLFNSLYSNNGWVYAFDSVNYNPVSDDPTVLDLGRTNQFASIGLYPQAGIHFNIGVKCMFE